MQANLTREQFVERYMTASKLTPYTMDGEVVSFAMDNGETWTQHALECRCGEDDCGGWAMIQDGGQNWHKFQNGLTDMTFEEATAADRAVMQRRYPENSNAE